MAAAHGQITLSAVFLILFLSLGLDGWKTEGEKEVNAFSPTLSLVTGSTTDRPAEHRRRMEMRPQLLSTLFSTFFSFFLSLLFPLLSPRDPCQGFPFSSDPAGP